MATGYTHDVSERDDMPFEEFAWNCARAFGALIHLRDSGWDAEVTIPKESSYHRKSLLQAENELKSLEKMTLSQAKKRAEKEHQESVKSAQDALDRQARIKVRYERMLAKVQAWIPPSEDHNGMKKFMIQQLQESIEHDCDGDYYRRMLKERVKSPRSWLNAQIRQAKDNIQYHQEHAKEDHQRQVNVAKWITLLQHSIPMPKKKSKK
jgi:hypothetical protein